MSKRRRITMPTRKRKSSIEKKSVVKIIEGSASSSSSEDGQIVESTMTPDEVEYGALSDHSLDFNFDDDSQESECTAEPAKKARIAKIKKEGQSEPQKNEVQTCRRPMQSSKNGVITVVPMKKSITELHIMDVAYRNNCLPAKNFDNQDLGHLLEGIKSYGASDNSLSTIKRKFSVNKSLAEIRAKVDEVRSLNQLSVTERQNQEHLLWTALERPKGRLSYNWPTFLARMMSKSAATNEAFTTKFCQVNLQAALLEEVNKQSTSLKTYKITDNPSTVKGIAEAQVSWKKIYETLAAWSQSSDPIDSLNNLESSIILSIIDELQFEAIKETTEERKRKLNGLFDALLQDDYRNFFSQVCSQPDERVASSLLIDPIDTLNQRLVSSISSSDIHNCNETEKSVLRCPKKLLGMLEHTKADLYPNRQSTPTADDLGLDVSDSSGSE